MTRQWKLDEIRGKTDNLARDCANNKLDSSVLLSVMDEVETDEESLVEDFMAEVWYELWE